MASCDGCQLQLLDAEEALLELAGAIQIVNFAEASSHMEPGPYDVTLVEGSISTPEQEEQIRQIRRDTRFLITIGACATSGGVQALRNATGKHEEFVRTVYPTPEYVASLQDSHPIADYVDVDLELTGCPIDRGELLHAISSLVRGAVPRISTSPVCVECKRRGYVCVVVAKGEPCLGPVTRTGCGALCPGWGRGCYGCFGPAQSSNNTDALGRRFGELGLSRKAVADRFRFITGWAPPFREAADELEGFGGSRSERGRASGTPRADEEAAR
ncbi:MAG TPA: sulfhydrogenase subunit delta [Actinomycetota bacterium]|nr:sulfhydrogenase subunit delta [Actinomycetota bacterium]